MWIEIAMEAIVLKSTFKIIVQKYGEPLYISASKCSPHNWNSDYSVKISWGRDNNEEIINNHFSYDQVFLVKWTYQKPIHLKRFRQNGSKVSAEKRANDYVEKLNGWLLKIKLQWRR